MMERVHMASSAEPANPDDVPSKVPNPRGIDHTKKTTDVIASNRLKLGAIRLSALRKIYSP